MALINCPECNKEISDKSKVCIHCGFPLGMNAKNSKCNINGKEYDLAFIFEEENKVKCIGTLRKMINCGLADAKNIIDDIIEKNEIPRTMIVKVQINQEPTDGAPRCPTCSSTDITRISTTAKVANIAMFGLLGNKRKKTFHCNSCKYEW